MRFSIKPFIAVCFAALTFTACKKDVKEETNEEGISQQVLSQIKNLGFSTTNVHQVEDGYLVEGDILLTPELLNSAPTSQFLRIANEEQYRTTNIVKGLPRTITISITGLGAAYIQGADIAIARYNAENLQIKFVRITSGKANITIRGFYQGPSGGYITLGSAGFPTRGGDPYREIKMNTHEYAYGSNPDPNYVGSVIQHELGHCIGFRHTDFMNRSFSCDGTPVNEGSGLDGAIHIPGTPTTADAGSWMLACATGTNQTFNTNDKVALNYLY